MWPFKKKRVINPSWYFKDGKWIHYVDTKDGVFLDGRNLSLKEQYEFGMKYPDIISSN